MPERVVSRAATTRRQARYADVHQRHAAGESMVQIAAALHMSRVTVRKYLSLADPPSAIEHHPPPSVLDPYRTYLETRWTENCRNARDLWREIAAQGYSAGYKVVQRWVALRREQPGRVLSAAEQTRAAAADALLGQDTPPHQTAHVPTEGVAVPMLPRPHSLVWLFLKRPQQLTETEHKWMQLVETDLTLATVAELSRRFVALVQERRAEGLTAWIEASRVSGIGMCQSFADGLQREYSAIYAGLSLAWSNGPVEGEVNKLKLVKRSMYGRGSFELLRSRVLRAA